MKFKVYTSQITDKTYEIEADDATEAYDKFVAGNGELIVEDQFPEDLLEIIETNAVSPDVLLAGTQRGF